MTKLLIILLAGLLCEAIGVVYLNKGLKQIGKVEKVNVSQVLRIVKNGVTNTNILLGVFYEALFFVVLLILLTKGTVSFVWPLTSLSFVFTTVAAKYFLHEEVSLARWGGVLLIMIGAGVITYTEKTAEAKTPATSTVQSTPSNQ